MATMIKEEIAHVGLGNQSAVQNNSGHLQCDVVAMDKYEVVTKALKDRGLSLTLEQCHVPGDLLPVF